MERVAIVARLKQGSGPRAAELIAAGPPFDLAETGIVDHSVYLSAGEVVFVFEGHQVEWMVDDLINDPFRPELQSAFDRWRSIVDGSPRIAPRTVRLGSTRARTARHRSDGRKRELSVVVVGVDQSAVEKVALRFAFEELRQATHHVACAVVLAEILRRGSRS